MRFPHVDIGRAVFAIALAVLLYFVALNETNPESRSQTTFTVPVLAGQRLTRAGRDQPAVAGVTCGCARR